MGKTRFIRKCKGHRIDNSGKERAAPSDFKVIIKLQISRQCGINGEGDKEINGTTQSPKADPHYGQSIFNNGAKAMQKRMDHLLNN